MTTRRDLLAEFQAGREEERELAGFDEWHATNGRCGRPGDRCTCFTTADMYVVAADGRCLPEPTP